ncbi:hypothetical protein F5Y12DRAFT_266569 [Xylaria sp. FL1777]|nr:hypothetical protein F5Y12DRAFT_266569 [Xylaria sp. FL1777]
MNFISWNKAFCIFPRATLLFGETVSLSDISDYDVELHKKYSRRGWRLRTRSITLGRADDVFNGLKKYPSADISPLGVLVAKDRRIGGSDTWTMKLSTSGVARPPQPDSVLEYSSFWVSTEIDQSEDEYGIRIQLDVFKSPSLRYQYTFGSLNGFWSYVGGVLEENTRMQLKTKMIQSEAKSIATGWRLYDAQFEKPDGWDFWDDWLPEAFEKLKGIEWLPPP